MTLYLIGLGLYNEKDISVRALDIVKNARHVFLESYTSILFCPKEQLERFYGREVIEMDRETVEGHCEEMLNAAITDTVVFLVVGDPLCATTHSDLMFRARSLNVPTVVIHNTSVVTAVASCGLQMYLFGEVVSIPFFQHGWTPESIYDKIKQNSASGLHTLCLLDIKVKEQTIENMMLGNDIYEPPRYMSINNAIQQLFQLEEKKKQQVCDRTVKAFGLARLGHPTAQYIASGTLEELEHHDFGLPLHSLVICSPQLHQMEEVFFTLHRACPLPPQLSTKTE